MQRKLWAKFDYDASTGKLCQRRNGREAGSVVRMKHLNYRSVYFERRSYRAHRLIWVMVYGDWPASGLDHVDGDGLNNRLVNLREATDAQNQANSRIQKNNTSGYKGVYYVKAEDQYHAQIMVNGKSHSLGRHKTAVEAGMAYERAALKMQGDFFNPRSCVKAKVFGIR